MSASPMPLPAVPVQGDSSSAILEALGRGATLLTGNQRTSRRWANAFDAGARARGDRSWQAAQILPWRAWTASLWHDAVVRGVEARVLLNDLQERALWQSVIHHAASESLQAVSSQARMCTDAMGLLGSYDVRARFAQGRYTPDARSPDAETFVRWYAHFEDLCRQESYLPSSHLDIEIASLIRQGSISLATEYLVCGFDRLTPSQDLVLDALRAAGAAVELVAEHVSLRRAPMLVQSASGRSEMKQCSAWVREQIENRPSCSIALIVPDLESSRPELERALRMAVSPSSADVTLSEQDAPYEFSTGRPLSHLPMMRDALCLLRWCAEDISIDDAGSLLRSPYLCLAASPELGAELEIRVLRETGALRGDLSLKQAAAALEHHEAGSRLHALASSARALQKVQNTFAHLVDSVRDLLHEAGWPGLAELNTDEFQAVDRWNEALDRLATLDLLGRRASFADLVDELRAVADETVFAPENTGAPVQVTTVSEAAGSTADVLWFLHADENTWPSRRAPHPLLPWWLQRDLSMPGTDTALDEAASRETLERVMQTAGEVVFSYACSKVEGAQRASRLVEEAVSSCGGTMVEPTETSVPVGPPALLEEEPDAERLPPLPDGILTGGVGVLTAQAQCGFRAFAEKRLFASAAERSDAGLSPGDRGEQVHAVLQAFWSTVHDQRTLLKMSAEVESDGLSQRDRLLQRCIDDVFRAAPHNEWENAYLGVQRTRLFKLLSDWLNFEAERPPFVVLHTEKELKDVAVGPLRLSMRVDRIDRVIASEAEGTLLIDYKTGSAFAREWLGERPDQPQLPVYAVAGALGAEVAQVDGLAFGAVKVGANGMRLEGMAETPKLLGPRHKNKIVFADQVEIWRRDLDRLATAFAAGDAAVDPKEYPKTCDLCAQRVLCRVDAETLLQLDEMAQEEEEDEVAAWS